jgi:CO/xanthine dehydrogenase FAD-binding subunit
MKAVAFDYVRAATIGDACARLAADPDARVLAGGQTLIPLLAMRLARPTCLVDIARIPALSGIREEGGCVVIGAATTQAAAEADALVCSRLPLLAKALPFIGHPATRHRGTIGGSLAHGDPAAEIPLVAVALQADLVVEGARGSLAMPAAQFYLGPMLTALPLGSVVAAARFPVWGATRLGTAFHEVAARASDFALVACAVQAAFDADGCCTAIAAAIGGVIDRPVRLSALGEALIGTRLEERRVREAVLAATSGLAALEDPHASAAYRRRVAGALARRAILEAKADALGEGHAG